MPVNLKEMFGKRWKVKFDQETSTFDRKDHGIEELTKDEWYYYIECPRGEIRAYGHDQLSLYHKSKTVLKNLEQLFSGEGAKSYISDKDGFLYFHPIIAEKIFEYVKARRRRTLSPEHLKKLSSSNIEFRFSSGKIG